MSGNSYGSKGVYSYICPDLVKEFNKYDTKRPKYTGIKAKSQRKTFPLMLVMTDPWNLKSFFYPDFANLDFSYLRSSRWGNSALSY